APHWLKTLVLHSCFSNWQINRDTTLSLIDAQEITNNSLNNQNNNYHQARNNNNNTNNNGLSHDHFTRSIVEFQCDHIDEAREHLSSLGISVVESEFLANPEFITSWERSHLVVK